MAEYGKGLTARPVLYSFFYSSVLPQRPPFFYFDLPTYLYCDILDSLFLSSHHLSPALLWLTRISLQFSHFFYPPFYVYSAF